MKISRRFNLIAALFFSMGLLMAGCSSDDDTVDDDDKEASEGCYIHLYDGDNFKDDNLKVEGPAEYADLDDLPGADGKNWTDEADSFKIGKDATVTVWYEKDFEGGSKEYTAGEYPSADEPYSLKITCKDDNTDE